MTEILFSVVVAVYNNEDYAHDLYRSIEAQTLDSKLLEIIIVDDGSTDSSQTAAREWQSRSKHDVRLIIKANGGVASARNAGIEASRGTWIAFVDSDDILDRNYFSCVAEFALRDSHSRASIMTTRSIIFDESRMVTIDNHPLSWKYKRGDRLVNLLMEPHVVHLGGHSTIVRRDIVMNNEIRFSELVIPGFEDAHFNGRYLACFEEPVVGLVASARYYYRKRANGSSLIDTTWTKTEKYTHEPRYGHLGMLQEITSRLGYTPEWSQNTVLYALYWYFSADRSWKAPFAGIEQSLLDSLWETISEIFEYIDPSVLRKFSLRNYGWYMSEGLLRHFKNETWASASGDIIYRWGAASEKFKTRKYVYTYVGDLPREQFYLNGRPVKPFTVKSIRHEFFGNFLMHERVIVLPSDSRLKIFLDGNPAQITNLPKFNRIPNFVVQSNETLILLARDEKMSPQMLASEWRKKDYPLTKKAILAARAFSGKAAEEAWVTGVSKIRSSYRITCRVLRRLIDQRRVRRVQIIDQKLVADAMSDPHNKRYDDAWIFIDRKDRADDNAEHLYRYVRDSHPEINSWFMIARDSPDWEKLSAAGFRLIPHSESEAVAPSLKAKFILSSHMDAEIYDLVDRHKYGRSTARRVFLQHGMTMNDISKWLNTKELAMVVASSQQELDAFVGDGTSYRLNSSQVVLSGMPRHDRLVRMSMGVTLDERQTIMIVPTWRKELSEALASATSDEHARQILITSDFYLGWSKLLASPAFSDLLEAEGLTAQFVLHDHLAEYASFFRFSDAIAVRRYSEFSIQDALIGSRLVITDYSSMSVEAAVAGANVIYYQFDSGAIFNGKHSFKRSWFDYERDGFGPVHFTEVDVLDSMRELAQAQWNRHEIYSDRLKSTLPNLDGMASSRVIDRLLAIRT